MLAGFYAKTEAGATYAAIRKDGRYFVVYGTGDYVTPFGCVRIQTALQGLIKIWHWVDGIALTGYHHAIKEL